MTPEQAAAALADRDVRVRIRGGRYEIIEGDVVVGTCDLRVSHLRGAVTSWDPAMQAEILADCRLLRQLAPRGRIPREDPN